MRLLLDTHIALWAAIDEALLNRGERALLEAAETTVVFSAVAAWELRLKWHSFHRSGARKGAVDPAEVVTFATDMGWEILPLMAHHAAAALTVPVPHKDPFDELLLVQAQEEGMRLLTRDAKLAGHPLAVMG